MLEIVDQLRQDIRRRERAQYDQALLNPKFIGGKVVSLINSTARYSAALERNLTDEDNSVTVSKLQRMIYVRLGTNCVGVCRDAYL